jgi:hypothetical protein
MVADLVPRLGVLLLISCGSAATPEPQSAAEIGPTQREQVLSAEASQLRFPEPGCERAHWPIRPCDAASHLERVGLWVIPGLRHFVYDGCTVAYRGAPADDSPETRYCGGGGTIVIHAEFGDPAPFYRARARWDGDQLVAETSLGPRPMARWEGTTFVSSELVEGARRDVRMERAEEIDEVSELSRPILCARRVQPSEEELVRDHGPECRDVGAD